MPDLSGLFTQIYNRTGADSIYNTEIVDGLNLIQNEITNLLKWFFTEKKSLFQTEPGITDYDLANNFQQAGVFKIIANFVVGAKHTTLIRGDIYSITSNITGESGEPRYYAVGDKSSNLRQVHIGIPVPSTNDGNNFTVPYSYHKKLTDFVEGTTNYESQISQVWRDEPFVAGVSALIYDIINPPEAQRQRDIYNSELAQMQKPRTGLPFRRW